MQQPNDKMSSSRSTLAERAVPESSTTTAAPSVNDEPVLEKALGEPSPAPSGIDEKNEATAEAEPAVPATMDDITDYPTGIRRLAIVAALILSVFLVSLDLTIVGTAIPKITDEFRGLDLVGWYGAAFFMT